MQSPQDDDTVSPPPQPLPAAPWFEAFATSLHFFTRLKLQPEKIHPLSACTLAFAPAGAVIGLIVGLVFVVLHWLGLPPVIGAFIALGCGLVLTGALHEDGLADCADALGGRDRETALTIMRDSRIGSFGALALILSLALRASVLVVLPGGVALAALIGAHAFSRGALGVALERLPAARRDGLGVAAGKPQARAAMLGLGLGAAIMLLACVLLAHFVVGLFALVLGGLAGLAVLEVARRRFGGYTGDVLGAMQQSIEIAALIAFTFFY
jgi:adenosylcobinamide-GDP ribazoletransferase